MEYLVKFLAKFVDILFLRIAIIMLLTSIGYFCGKALTGFFVGTTLISIAIIVGTGMRK